MIEILTPPIDPADAIRMDPNSHEMLLQEQLLNATDEEREVGWANFTPLIPLFVCIPSRRSESVDRRFSSRILKIMRLHRVFID